MKWTLFASITLGLLTLSVFQNCAPSHNDNVEKPVPFDILKVYPYLDARPDYLNNIQLTKVFEDSGLWKYQFVASAVHIDAPETDIDVDIRILDQDNNLLCLSKQVRVNSSTNHIMIDNCNSSRKATVVNIKVFIKLATELVHSRTPISTYTFSLE